MVNLLQNCSLMRKMKWIAGALLGPLWAAAQPPAGVADVSVFKGAGDSAQVQTVWQLDPAVLHYKTDSAAGGIRAEYVTRAQLLLNGKEVKGEAWRVRTPVMASPAQIAGLNLLDGWNVPAVAGNYTLRVSFWGSGWEDKPATLSMPVNVPSFEGKTKILSQPQLLDTAYGTAFNSASPFAKNGHARVPLVTDFLGEERQQLRFYAEAYNFKESDFKRGKLRWQARILKGEVPVAGFSETDSSGAGFFWEGALSIAALPTGNYVLKTFLADAAGKEAAASQRSFQRSNVGYEPPVDTTIAPVAGTVGSEAVGPRGRPLDLKNSFVGKFTEAQLPLVLRMLQPQATPEEGLAIQQLSGKVDPLYRRGFIYTFWMTRDPENPEQAWNAYADRVRYVNREFKMANRVGYETDRGRVYLHYGAPAERVKVVQESGSLPYEIWKYTDTEGHTGAFLFYQAAGPLDDYAQLHSTVKGAVKNYNWRRFLYTGSINERSRAEQYFPERN